MTSCKHKNDDILRQNEPENYRNKKRNISLALLQAEIEYSQFLTSWHDVMTWDHHANTKLITFSNSATQSIIETKKRIIFLAHLQAEIGKIILVASCRDGKTSRCHVGWIKISQLHPVNGTWGYGRMALLVEAKMFSFKINLILCHNVNFDVTIMTSWRHFFINFRMVLKTNHI